MNPYFLTILLLVGLFIWTVGSYSFWRISQRSKSRSSQVLVQPVFRLAEQWLVESQRKMEDLIQKSEQPLSTAQNELLELRLEASRLPQGVKNLRMVRESLAHPLRPVALQKKLVDITKLYLDEGDFRRGEEGVVYFKTSMGEMPCMEVEGESRPLSDAQMKVLLSEANRVLGKKDQNPVAGGFIYFGNDKDYQTCLANGEWMEGLKGHRLMVMDFKGLTALLISLRLSKDVDRVVRVFSQGVQTTVGLTGQSDKMSEALSALSANSLKTRTVMEGNPPGDLKVAP